MNMNFYYKKTFNSLEFRSWVSILISINYCSNEQRHHI